MGDSKITRGELADFAKQTAAYIEPIARQAHGASIVVDALIEVLGPEVAEKVKAELERRKAEATKPGPAPEPKIDPCECCGAPGNTGSMPYGIYCDPCGGDIAHPTGDGSCFVRDGREHKTRRPGYCEACGWYPPIDSEGVKTPGHLCPETNADPPRNP